MQAGLTTVISTAQVSCGHTWSLAKPELSLRRAARENDVGELLDFLANRSIGSLS